MYYVSSSMLCTKPSSPSRSVSTPQSSNEGHSFCRAFHAFSGAAKSTWKLRSSLLLYFVGSSLIITGVPTYEKFLNGTTNRPGKQYLCVCPPAQILSPEPPGIGI